MFKIGELKINTQLILAPLSGVSDIAFRMLCRKFGCRFAFTEMLNAASINYKSKKAKQMLNSHSKDKPLGAQVLGRDINFLLKAIEVIEKSGVSLIDFNAACPVRKVVRRGEGAALLREPKLLAKIIKELSRHTTLPLTVKIRSGWSKDSINAVDIAKLLEDAGAAAVIIHARTKDQLYRGKADYSLIKKVKSQIQIPVIGSGDIFSALDVERMLNETGSDAVLVARGAMGNPWIFKQTAVYLKTGNLLPPPNLKQRIKIIIKHLDMLIELYTEKRAVPKMRLFINLYLKGIPGARKVRGKLSQIKTKKQLIDELNNL